MKKNKNYANDIRDICYFVKHVKNLNLRISLIESLGYRIGVNVVTKCNYEMEVTIGKRKEIRVQITPQLGKTPIAKCAIID